MLTPDYSPSLSPRLSTLAMSSCSLYYHMQSECAASALVLLLVAGDNCTATSIVLIALCSDRRGTSLFMRMGEMLCCCVANGWQWIATD